MKKVWFIDMTPDELAEQIGGRGIVYLPVGSMEWHGPHLGMGTDAINAGTVAARTALRTGGAVFPPLYIGTETFRTPESLAKIGFDRDAEIIGMDFPKNSFKSMYWPPDLFETIVETQLKMLRAMGFRKIVVINGHAAPIQIEVLEQLCKRLSSVPGAVARQITILFPGCGAGLGHAGLAETAIMQYARSESVRLDALPPKPQKLYYADWGIADSGGSDTDFSVRYDPRDATAALGEQITEYAVERCVEIISKLEKQP